MDCDVACIRVLKTWLKVVIGGCKGYSSYGTVRRKKEKLEKNWHVCENNSASTCHWDLTGSACQLSWGVGSISLPPVPAGSRNGIDKALSHSFNEYVTCSPRSFLNKMFKRRYYSIFVDLASILFSSFFCPRYAQYGVDTQRPLRFLSWFLPQSSGQAEYRSRFRKVQHRMRGENFKENFCSTQREIINTVWEANQRQDVNIRAGRK